MKNTLILSVIFILVFSLCLYGLMRKAQQGDISIPGIQQEEATPSATLEPSRRPAGLFLPSPLPSPLQNSNQASPDQNVTITQAPAQEGRGDQPAVIESVIPDITKIPIVKNIFDKL